MDRLIELTGLITQWGVDRRIVQNATAFAQTRKTHEEFCELVAADSKLTNVPKYLGTLQDALDEVKDAIGDIYVTLVMVCACNDTPIRMELDCPAWIHDEKLNSPLKYIESLIPDLIRDAVEDNTTVRITARRIVCGLMALCDSMGLDFVECVELAYREIEHRKGTLREDGVFVKEESVSP